MAHIETDYLIIGSGAVGLAFADTLLDETDAHITLVDRHGKPGGHWNDAYSFVTLHQPSAFYGVNSMELGADRIDTVGLNKGMYELASGAEVSGYFDRVMNQKLLPSGRVSYHPMCDYLGDGRFVRLLSGEKRTVTRAQEDGGRHLLQHPGSVDPDAANTGSPRACAWSPPNALPQLWQSKARPPGPLRHPRRRQDGDGRGGVAAQLRRAARGHQLGDAARLVAGQPHEHPARHGSSSRKAWAGRPRRWRPAPRRRRVDDLFERLEASDQMMRIDPQRKPTMFHYATLSQAEVELLRRIKQVIRLGRVQAIEPGEMVLDQGRVPVAANTLFIDCTASAVEPRPVQPIFQGDRLVLQIVRMPLPTFSAALVAYVEAHYDDDAVKNQLCAHDCLPHTRWRPTRPCVMGNMMNQFKWGQDKALRQWMRNSRLDGFGKMISGIDPADEEKLAIMARFKAGAMAAMGNLPKLMTARRTGGAFTA